MNTVKSFTVGYAPINERNIFSSGDFISGQVMLELSKDTDISVLSVKMKGKAEVRWTERHGKRTVTYHSKEKYFTLKQFLVEEGQGNHHLSKGCSVYPFSFQIPHQDLPSSFKGQFGKILYMLEANLSRSMRVDSKAKAEFILVSKNLNTDSCVMAPQHGIKEKKMNLFNSGHVSMDVKIDKTGFQQGEGIKVLASVHNKSSRDVCPKYCVYQKSSSFAKGKRKLETKIIAKEVGGAVPPSAGQSFTQIITIPDTTTPSIFNCSNIKVEYRLKVYLDVKYALDPEIKFPVIVLPPAQSFGARVPPVWPTFTAPASNDPPPYSAVTPSAPVPPFYGQQGVFGIYPSLPGYDSKS